MYASRVTRKFVRDALRYNDSNILREMAAVTFAPAVFFKTLLLDGHVAYECYKASQSKKGGRTGYIQL